MNQRLVATRNWISRAIYRGIIKPLAFRFDPESIHNRAKSLGIWLGRGRFGRGLARAGFDYPAPESLAQTINGNHFPNPVGLAAGFDKNAELVDILPAIGFGFMEIGSVTARASTGNPLPRLWRLPASRGLVVYYGLANDGVETIAARLSNRQFSIPLGISIAMTNCQANLDLNRAIADYTESLNKLKKLGDYLVINVSCPNAQGGQPFAEPANLERLLVALDQIPTQRPVWAKLSPDMSRGQTNEVVAILKAHRLHGVICGNLTKNRANPRLIDGRIPTKGGVSGYPFQTLADQLVAQVYRQAGKKLTIIGCGGIFSAEDAYRKIRLGASLVQLITGLIFEGPQLVSEINRQLAKYLQRDGFKHLNEVIGVDNN